jgi:1,2-dihydroxy-3-keto-5-methylthiopentene dioxygenase
MSRLTIYPENNSARPILDTTDAREITRALKDIGVVFERWKASAHLSQSATNDDVLNAYKDDVERIKREQGFSTADVLRVNAATENKAAIRAKFLNEHTHDEHEVRFFVEGAGMFYLRVGGKVHMILCERGDLLSVPKGTPHWFDMGENPDITAIRFFTEMSGWVPHFTGDKIADAFPKFESNQRTDAA